MSEKYAILVDAAYIMPDIIDGLCVHCDRRLSDSLDPTEVGVYMTADELRQAAFEVEAEMDITIADVMDCSKSACAGIIAWSWVYDSWRLCWVTSIRATTVGLCSSAIPKDAPARIVDQPGPLGGE